MAAITRLPEGHTDLHFFPERRELCHIEDVPAGSEDDVVVLTACARRELNKTQQRHCGTTTR